jgi:predicted Zn-dependent protease
MEKMSKSVICTGLIVFIVIFWIVSCAINPVTGKRELMLMTEADEIAMGKETDPAICQNYGVYEDAELTAYINDLGQRMAKKTHRPNLQYTFRVLDTPVVNAFAVPGGYVYLTRGILAYLNDEAELAGVMGHELGHISARHSAKQYSQQQLAQLGLGVGMIFSEKFRQYAGLAQMGMSLLFLKFSRDDERQADDLGVEYSIRNMYDSNAMAAFFETLERMSPSTGANALPEWFSTHPNPVNRIGAVRQKTAVMMKQYPGIYIMNKPQYLAQIDGVVFGEDPRQGYVENGVFYHPGLKFQFPVPANWQVTNTPAQVQIASQKQDAAILFTLANSSSPAAAAQEFVSGASARVLSSDAVSVSGYPCQRVVSQVPSEQDTLGVLSYFIQKEAKMYVFHGYASKGQFPGYRPNFSATGEGFKPLTDQAKINVKPQHLAVKKVDSPGAVRDILLKTGIAGDKLEQYAILNGLQLTDSMAKNSMIKLMVK